jgi:single-strand DNA-binding protein
MAERSINKQILLGRIGKTAETKFTPSGVAKTTFSVATSNRYKKGEEWVENTTWHNVVLWRSENLANFLTKGTQAYVEGRTENRSYEAQDGTKKYISEVIADQVILCGGEKPEPSSRPRRSDPKPVSQDMGITDEDVPF